MEAIPTDKVKNGVEIWNHSNQFLESEAQISCIYWVFFR